MFSNNGHFIQNRKQQNLCSEHVVRSSPIGNSIHNPISTKKRMEKLVIHVLLGTGFVSYLWALFLNVGSWKGDILALLGFAFILVKFIRLCIRTWQDYRKEEIEIKVLKKKSEKS
jgi:hypothetical protein